MSSVLIADVGIPLVLVVGLLLLVAVAKANERRVLRDPELGLLRHDYGTRWYGRSSFAGQMEVDVSLPGGPDGPLPGAKAWLERLQAGFPDLTPHLERVMAAEYAEVRGEYVDIDPEFVAQLDEVVAGWTQGAAGSLHGEFWLWKVEVPGGPEGQLSGYRLQYRPPWDQDEVYCAEVTVDLSVESFTVSNTFGL